MGRNSEYEADVLAAALEIVAARRRMRGRAMSDQIRRSFKHRRVNRRSIGQRVFEGMRKAAHDEK